MLDQITELPLTLAGVAAVDLVAVATLRFGLGSMIPEPEATTAAPVWMIDAARWHFWG
jgi:hypothetical protein